MWVRLWEIFYCIYLAKAHVSYVQLLSSLSGLKDCVLLLLLFSFLRGAESPVLGRWTWRHIFCIMHLCVPSLKRRYLVDVTVWPVFLASAEASSLNASHHALLMVEAGTPWSASFCRWRSCRAAESPSLKGRMLSWRLFFFNIKLRIL